MAAKRRSEQYGILTAELKDNSDDDLRIMKPDGAVAAGDIAADTTTAATGFYRPPEVRLVCMQSFLVIVCRSSFCDARHLLGKYC